MKSLSLLPGFVTRFLGASLLMGGMLAGMPDAGAGEKLVFSGRLEKRGLPDLTDRERFLPGAVNLLPQSASPGPEFSVPVGGNSGGNSAATRRQQELLVEKRNWIEAGQKRGGPGESETPTGFEKPADAENRGANPFERNAPKPELKRIPSGSDAFNPRSSSNPAGGTREDASRPANQTGAGRDDAFGRNTGPGARLPGEFNGENRGAVDLPVARLAPRLGLGGDTVLQQRIDRDSQFRQLLDPKVAGASPRAADFFSLSPELQRQQQQQSMGRAFEDILRRPDAGRSLDATRPKSPLAGNPLNVEGPKASGLNDFSRIMAPPPAPERPRPTAAPFEFPKRAF